MQPGVERQCRARVSGIVEPDDRHTGLFSEALEELAEPVGVVAVAVGLDEDEPAFG